MYPFQQVRVQRLRSFADIAMSGCVLVKPEPHFFRSASRVASSVGGVGDFCQRSGSKSAIDPNALKSLNRYKTSTKYSHSFSPCRRALDNTDITIADHFAASGLPKNNQFFLPTTNSRNVRSETLCIHSSNAVFRDFIFLSIRFLLRFPIFLFVSNAEKSTAL